MAPLPAPAEKPSHRVSDSQSHAKVRPPAQVAVFCAALWPNLQPALTDDAFGTHEGRDAIRALRHLPFAVHYVMNPIIDIDGDTATGKWLLLEPCSFPQGDERQPIWVAAKYEDDYPRVDGEWKFKRVKLMSLMWSPYEQGLEKQRIIGQ